MCIEKAWFQMALSSRSFTDSSDTSQDAARQDRL